MEGYLSLSHEECVPYVEGIVRQCSDPSSYWMVFDLDETLITDANYRGTFKCNADTFKFQYRGIHDPIEPMVKLYNWCASLGMKMCIITARGKSLRPATERNIVHAGIKQCHRLYTKIGRIDTIQYKTACRDQLDGPILFNIGDQATDLAGSTAIHNIKLPSSY
jgi:predicted secreted acid phosphatase